MKIALLGYGVEGASAYRHFKQLDPKAEFEIYDNAAQPKYDIPEGVVLRAGVESFHDIDADLVIKTPAIAPSKVSARGKVSSVTQEFFEACPVPIVGVTGTKGKGTTSTLIANILRKAGIKTWLVGNIGLAAFDVFDEIIEAHNNGENCVVVYELSSFQLWDIKKSPHVAVVLMIEPEHLNVHADFDDYVRAKANIVAFQSKNDVTIYYANNEVTADIGEHSPGKKIPYIVEPGPSLKVNGEAIVDRSDISLYGEHNIGNVQAAILTAWQFTQDKQAIKEAVREFKGLPHRLESVAMRHDVEFINDSFSSAPPATLAAVKAFSQPKILIMGGFDRGLDFSETARKIAAETSVKKVLLMGATKDIIASGFETCDWHEYEIISGDLTEVVTRANKLAEPGDVVILSPGCASFDMFKNFEERGNTFKKLVAEL